MHLVQIILPLRTKDGQKIPRQLFDAVRQELVREFGGVTAFTRSPAEGFWETHGDVQRDDVILYEVMADAVDRAWWAKYRELLESRFSQQEIVIRAQAMERL